LVLVDFDLIKVKAAIAF